MTINTLPTAPTRTMSPADFVAAANTFLAALPTFSSQVNADLAALLTLSQLVSTSTTSLTIGTGSKSLTVQTSKAYLTGQAVRVYSTATPDNYMDGTVTSYDSGTGALVVNVTATNGSGTLAAWTVILNGGLATTADLNAAVTQRALLAGSALQAFSTAALTTTGAFDISGANAGQIKFPASQNPSTNANTLDDYAEGTWTPVATSGSGAITSYTSSGTYTKIGNVVIASCTITITNNGTGATNGVISGLPFACGSIGVSAAGRNQGTTGSTEVLTIAAGATSGALYTYNNAYPWATNAVTTLTIVYRV